MRPSLSEQLRFSCAITPILFRSASEREEQAASWGSESFRKVVNQKATEKVAGWMVFSWFCELLNLVMLNFLVFLEGPTFGIGFIFPSFLSKSTISYHWCPRWPAHCPTLVPCPRCQGLTWAFWSIVGSLDEKALNKLSSLESGTRRQSCCRCWRENQRVSVLMCGCHLVFFSPPTKWGLLDFLELFSASAFFFSFSSFSRPQPQAPDRSGGQKAKQHVRIHARRKAK